MRPTSKTSREELTLVMILANCIVILSKFNLLLLLLFSLTYFSSSSWSFSLGLYIELWIGCAQWWLGVIVAYRIKDTFSGEPVMYWKDHLWKSCRPENVLFCFALFVHDYRILSTQQQFKRLRVVTKVNWTVEGGHKSVIDSRLFKWVNLLANHIKFSDFIAYSWFL